MHSTRNREGHEGIESTFVEYHRHRYVGASLDGLASEAYTDGSETFSQALTLTAIAEMPEMGHCLSDWLHQNDNNKFETSYAQSSWRNNVLGKTQKPS